MTLKRLMWLVVADVLFAGVLLQVVTHHLWVVGILPEYCRGTVVHTLRELATLTQGTDSWKPMMSALPFVHAPSGIYQAAFFDHQIKFQYPLPSLLPMWFMERAGMAPAAILSVLKMLSAAALLLTVGVCVDVALRSAPPQILQAEKHSRLVLGITAFLISFTFYPVMWAYSLGQIQVFLNLMFSIAFLCWQRRSERAAGALIGIITLVKPQYAMILLWGVLRKRWGFVVSGLTFAVTGLIASVAVFGFSDNLQYLKVLSFLSSHGETFYPNQSVNGLLNRLAGHAGNVIWKAGFPPYHPAIYIATLVTSVAIFVWAVPLRIGSSEESRMMDFSLIGVAATAASPIAWEHHYGIILPILLWQVGAFVVPALLSRAQSVAFIAAYLLIANDLRLTNLFAFSWLNVLQSYLFFGVLILIALLRSELQSLGARPRSAYESLDREPAEISARLLVRKTS